MLPRTITLTHANLNEKIEIAVALVAGFYHSPGHKCTHVVASGGAIFPALESVEEVKRLYNGAVTGTLTSAPSAPIEKTEKQG